MNILLEAKIYISAESMNECKEWNLNLIDDLVKEKWEPIIVNDALVGLKADNVNTPLGNLSLFEALAPYVREHSRIDYLTTKDGITRLYRMFFANGTSTKEEVRGIDFFIVKTMSKQEMRDEVKTLRKRCNELSLEINKRTNTKHARKATGRKDPRKNA